MDLLSEILDGEWKNLTIDYAEPWTVPWVVPAGERDDYEIHLVEKGEGIFCSGGRNYSVKPGDIIILYSFDGNSFKADGPDFRHIFVTFKIKESLCNEKNLELNRLLAFNILPLKPGNVPELQQLFHQMHKIISVRSGQYMFKLKILLGTLVDKLKEGCMEEACENLESIKAFTGKNTRELVDRVIMFLYKNYNAEVRLEDIGRMVSLHPRYLCTVFRQITGHTINDFLRQIRLERAKRLLLYTSLSITDIALETGFGSSQYFSRVFNQSEGVEPRVFRKMRINVNSICSYEGNNFD